MSADDVSRSQFTESLLSNNVPPSVQEILARWSASSDSLYARRSDQSSHEALFVLLPLLIVLSALLILVLIFLLCALLIRRRRGIILRDQDGPIDMSRQEFMENQGEIEVFETRWLESVGPSAQRAYIRARDFQLQYPPNSLPTDITLSQFLSIQEKGVSAWCFEPDYETIDSLLVHTRTEITFLPDPASSSCVQSNLPLPKLNEVYYWEVKMFDLPEATNVAIGLATKPYPAFRLPGQSRYSVAYFSNGDKSHNFPFTASPFGPLLKEGDVLGVGYRPRSGTVFFTRNGRKMDDAYVGFTRWNLFPTIGADGPCSVHANLGQAGFVFIEANVKKWGLAPSVGTLAPPPAYGSERGSILLDVGGGVRTAERPALRNIPGASSQTPRRRSHRHHRPRLPASPGNSQAPTSPSAEVAPHTPPPPITPIEEIEEVPSTPSSALSSSDLPYPTDGHLPVAPSPDHPSSEQTFHPSSSSSSSGELSLSGLEDAGSSRSPRGPDPSSSIPPTVEPTVTSPLSPESPPTPNPPTPGQLDIHLQSLPRLSPNRREHTRRSESCAGASGSPLGESSNMTPLIPRRDPPAYSPLDAYRYAEGVHVELPAEFIAAALDGSEVPSSVVGRQNPQTHRHRSNRSTGW